MSAHGLIADIFSRVQGNMPGNRRGISRAQLDFLLRMIGEDEERSAVQSGGPGVTIWAPSGRDKYVIREDARGNRHTLERVASLVPSGMGRMF